MPTGSETVLVVEDDDTVLNLVQRTLTKQGYKVLMAVTSHLALQICEQYPDPIHLLLTDVIMPDMGGKELVECIQKLRPGISVLYMSGYTVDIREHQGHLSNSLRVLQKPFTAVTLAKHVRNALENRELPGL